MKIKFELNISQGWEIDQNKSEALKQNVNILIKKRGRRVPYQIHSEGLHTYVCKQYHILCPMTGPQHS